MLVLNSNIKISENGKILYTFDYICELNINSSWEEYTDTCILSIPNKFKKDNKSVIVELKKGLEIEISLGYLPNLVVRFVGYISKVSNGSIIDIECEDKSYLLKQTSIREYSEQGLTLKKLIDDLIGLTGLDLEYVLIDENAEIGTWILEDVTFMDALEGLKKYGLWSYFENGILKITKPYLKETSAEILKDKTKDFYFDGKNCNIIDSDLEYIDVNDVTMVIKGVSTDMANNTKIELYAYYDSKREIVISDSEKSGSLQTHTFVNETKESLSIIIKDILQKHSYTGYKGGLTTFGEPVIKHGNFVKIHDLNHVEREGRYMVKGVVVNFGNSGYRQDLELGLQN